jgi:hypothetical protein
MTPRSIVRSAALVCVFLAMPLLPTGVAFARKDCRARIQQEQQKLDRAVRQHGEHSRQAEKERHKLGRLRDACRAGH